METNLNLYHTILSFDINIIKNRGIKPIKGDYSIICDNKYYFYDNQTDLNKDFKFLTSYLGLAV